MHHLGWQEDFDLVTAWLDEAGQRKGRHIGQGDVEEAPGGQCHVDCSRLRALGHEDTVTIWHSFAIVCHLCFRWAHLENNIFLGLAATSMVVPWNWAELELDKDGEVYEDSDSDSVVLDVVVEGFLHFHTVWYALNEPLKASHSWRPILYLLTKVCSKSSQF